MNAFFLPTSLSLICLSFPPAAPLRPRLLLYLQREGLSAGISISGFEGLTFLQERMAVQVPGGNPVTVQSPARLSRSDSHPSHPSFLSSKHISKGKRSSSSSSYNHHHHHHHHRCISPDTTDASFL